MPKLSIHTINQRTVLLIFGMHRSGTSAFAGLLKESGIPMGKALMKPAFDNPRGFYEDERVVAFNEQILNILGQSWETIAAMPANWMNIQQVQDLQKEATEFIQIAFNKLPLFALKDPRFSLTFPFWQAIFQKLNINTKQYILVRHPYEVAHSLWKRNQLPKVTATALWMKYMLEAVTVIDPKNSQFISFETVVNQPQKVLQSLAAFVKDNLKESTTIADSFIHQGLRHHYANQPIQEPLLQETYALFSQLTKDTDSAIELTKLTKIRQSEAFKEWIPSIDLMASLSIDYGNGFSEFPPLKQKINLVTTQLSFDLTNPEKGIPIRFRLNFANQLVALNLTEICWTTATGQLIPIDNFASTALIELEQNYVFNKNGFIEFYPLLNGPKIQQVTANLTYQKLGVWAETAIPDLSQALKESVNKRTTIDGTISRQAPKSGTTFSPNSTINGNKSNFWLSFLQTGLSSPITFLKNVNLENFNTLRKALLNEPPTLILSNLKKKLFKQATNNQHHWSQEKTTTVLTKSARILKELEETLSEPIPQLPQQKRLGKVLYFSTYLPDFDTSSGGKRATRYLALLAEEMEVFVYTLGKQEPKYVAKLTALGIQVLPPMSYEQLKQEIPAFKAIICATYMSFSEVSVLAQQYPNAQLIVDTVDVHWIREARSIGLIADYTKEKVAENKAREIAVYEQADSIWAVTEVDKQAILAEIPTAKIAIISNVHEPLVEKYVDNGQHTLLFIGNYKHEPNIFAAQTLALTIFPKVKAAFKTAELIIAGAHAPKSITDLGKLPAVTFKGFIEETALAVLYQDAFLSVSPLLAGAGIKGKICEAIAYNTPVVTTPIGNEGINLVHEKDGLIGALETLADSIIKCLKREYDFETMTNHARQKLASLVGPKAVKDNLLGAFFPAVTICIVTWNGIDLLKKCLASIDLHTHYPNYKIVVYSNACTDGTVDYLKRLAATNDKVIPILAETNEVFVKPNNKMMRLFPENEVILLNNDTEVTTNWLLELHRAAYASKNIGIAGSKILYPDGQLQEYGAELYAHGGGQNIGKGDNPNNTLYQMPKLAGYVSGCAMYIKRSTIDQIGVFDEQFHPCYYEDSDYCYAAAAQGLQTVVTPYSVIYHKEGATAGQDTNTGFKRYQAINRDKFIKKHFGKKNGINWLPTNGSPVLIDKEKPTTFIFTHIPKCGGTSFRQFINETALNSGIKKEAIYIPGFNGLPNDKNIGQLNEMECQLLKQRDLKILANHSKFEAHTAMGISLEKPFYFTLLREPISRFISHYNFFYFKQGLDGCKNIPLDELPTAKQQGLIEKLANLQVIYLANGTIGMEADNAALLKKAQYNLENIYGAYGLLEEMENAIKQLQVVGPTWLKWSINFPFLNKNKAYPTISKETIELIKKANKWDLALYDWAKEQVTKHLSVPII